MYSLCFCIGTIISLVTANLFREIPYIVKLVACDPPFWPYPYTKKDIINLLFLDPNFMFTQVPTYTFTYTLPIYGIRRSLNGLCSITEVKQRRARFIIGWVTACDCQVLYTLLGLREPRNFINRMARLTDFELDVKELQWT